MSLLTRLLARGTVVLANSATKLQSLQMRLTAGEVNDDMEHFEPYGFTSNPLAGAEGIAMGTRFLLTSDSPTPRATLERYLAVKRDGVL